MAAYAQKLSPFQLLKTASSQKLLGALAAEITLVPCFQKLLGALATEAASVPCLQKLLGALAAEITLVPVIRSCSCSGC